MEASVQGVLATVTGQAAESAAVDRARAGDRDAFDWLVESRLESTFRTAQAILGNESDARDATQDIFVRAWRHLPQLRDTDQFPAWFGRIVVNTCRSAARGRGRRRVREIAVASLPDGGESLAARDVPHETRMAELDLLERALEHVSPADRTLLALHHHDHLPLAEIGTLLGIPARTVKSRMFNARRSLERALEVEAR